MNREDFLWSQKYRPRKIDDVILPASLKNTFKEFVTAGEIPNLLLTGPAGVGKTTVAVAMCEELDCDYKIINGSMNGNIDTLRVEIANFASSISFTGSRKIVILDEADYLNPQSTQPALRNFMEEYSKNCGFILTCNFPQKILEPLRSRTSVVSFRPVKTDSAKQAIGYFKRASEILTKEGVPFEKEVLADVVKRYYPDFRKVLNELQVYAKTGRIDSGILARFTDDNLKGLMGHLKAKNFKEMRKWVAENGDIETEVVMRGIYDNALEYVTPKSVPGIVVTLAKYQFQEAFVSDKEINLVACLTELMIESEFI